MKLKWKLCLTAVLLVATLGLGGMAIGQQRLRQKLSFADSLDAVAVVVDGEALTLQDMALYIAHQEQSIEEKAVVYNPENTGEYWNLYTNHSFLRNEGKQMVLDTAVHDEIFYRLALEEKIALTEQEEAYLANAQYDFWSDLEEEQRKRLGVSEDVIKESMRKVVFAEKYQYLLAEMNSGTIEDYAVHGDAYQELLETHDCELDETIWNRVPFGSITVNH